MPDQVEDLLNLLDLEPIEVNLFRGQSPADSWQRVFGGQVIGQALVAAQRTVEEDRHCHSLHAYFIRPGDPKVPIVYEVDRSRDGRSFSTRRVIAIQHGKQIFNMAASFQVREEGFDHQFPMPDVPGPDDLPTELSMREAVVDRVPRSMRDRFLRPRPIELRFVEPPSYFDAEKRDPISHVWFRAVAPTTDNVALNQCVLAYASDMTLLDTCINPHGVTWMDGTVQSASLDHAMWFHRPFKADEWMLYAQDAPSASFARGFNRGNIFTQDGTLIASVTQEGLIRPRKPA